MGLRGGVAPFDLPPRPSPEGVDVLLPPPPVHYSAGGGWAEPHWLEDVRRLLRGGVGAMGLRGGVAPFDLPPRPSPEGVDVLLPPPPAPPVPAADGRSLIDE